MQPPARNMRVSCNDDEQSFEAQEETRDLEGKQGDNQIKVLQTASFARQDTLLTEIKQTETEESLKIMNKGPANQVNNAGQAAAAAKTNPKSLIWMLLVSLMVSQLMYLLLITIVVPYGRRKFGNNLNAIHYGVIASMQQVARIVFSIYIGKTLQKVGKKNYILIGFGLMIFASVGFSLTQLISEAIPYAFFIVCLVLNFIMGAGATCLQIIAQAIVLLQFGAKREVGLAYLSAARGLGFLGGPILGQYFVNSLGYWQSFVIFSVFLFIALVVAFFVLPSSLNVDNSKTAIAMRKTEQLKQAQAQVTYGEIFRIPRAQFALFTVMIAMIFSLFMSTYASQYIQEIVEIPQTQVGYYIAIWAFCYTLSAFFVGPLTKKISSAYVSFGSYLLITIGCIFFGPSKILNFGDSDQEFLLCNTKFGPSCYERMDKTKPNYQQFCDDLFNLCEENVRDNNRELLILGLIFLGLASGSVIVPILVELVTAVKDALGAKPGANEKGSALFTMFGAIGSILASILGSMLYEILDNRYASDIFGVLSLIMAVVFFLMNISPGYLVKKKSSDTAVSQNAAATNNQRITQTTQQQQQQPLMQRNSHFGDKNSRQITNGNQSNTFRSLRQIEEAEARKSRIVSQNMHASGNDLLLPVTQEQKMYLEGIDEDAYESSNQQETNEQRRSNMN